jgi:hypothetical protein
MLESGVTEFAGGDAEPLTSASTDLQGSKRVSFGEFDVL